jgi:hypothetical protein
MKLAAAIAVAIGLAACGTNPHRHAHAKPAGDAGEDSGDGIDRPKTHDAAERARAEAANAPEESVSGDGKHWGGWRYQGARDDCFYVVGRRCFTDEKKACAAAKCKSGECDVSGGGPATVTCEP